MNFKLNSKLILIAMIITKCDKMVARFGLQSCENIEKTKGPTKKLLVMVVANKSDKRSWTINPLRPNNDLS